MNTKRDTPPSNLRSLQARIDNEAASRNQPVRRIMRAVANVAVGQMLPPSVVKGGTAMKLRVGEPGSRFTPDFDASRSSGAADSSALLAVPRCRHPVGGCVGSRSVGLWENDA